MPDWFPVDFVNSWVAGWATEIVFSLFVGMLAGLVTMFFGEGQGKGK